MRCYKSVSDGYIISVGTGAGNTEITEQEYNQILGVIQNKPAATETTDYRLKTDLTWEAYAVEPQPYEPTDTDKAEAYDILMGVES